MESLRDELFSKLLKKTEVLGREATFQEVAEDPNLPNPNDYAYYYGSFSQAAKEAWNSVRRGEQFTRLEDRLKGVVIVSNNQPRKLSEERTATIISEFVDMFIENDGRMPSSRDVKKNRYISEKEVQILRQSGGLQEKVIRKLAEEKSGRTFMSPEERRKKEAAEAREKRLQKIAELDAEQKLKNELEAPKVEEKSEVEEPEVKQEPEVQIEKEVEKMSDERKGRRYTPEECKELLTKACRKAGHVLTQAEVNELSKTSDFPGWATLQRKIGPWWNWGGKDNEGGLTVYRFANEKLERVAAAKRQEEAAAFIGPKPAEAQEAKENGELERFFSGKKAALAQEPTVEESEAPEPKPMEAPEEAFEEVSTPTPEPMVALEEIGDALPEVSEETPVAQEAEPEVVEHDDGTVEIPIKLIIPKGIRGSVQISLEF